MTRTEVRGVMKISPLLPPVLSSPKKPSLNMNRLKITNLIVMKEFFNLIAKHIEKKQRTFIMNTFTRTNNYTAVINEFRRLFSKGTYPPKYY